MAEEGKGERTLLSPSEDPSPNFLLPYFFASSLTPSLLDNINDMKFSVVVQFLPTAFAVAVASPSSVSVAEEVAKKYGNHRDINIDGAAAAAAAATSPASRNLDSIHYNYIKVSQVLFLLSSQANTGCSVWQRLQ